VRRVDSLGDIPVGCATGGHAGDLQILRGELEGDPDRAASGVFASGRKFHAGTGGETVDPEPFEDLQRSAELYAGFASPPTATQPGASAARSPGHDDGGCADGARWKYIAWPIGTLLSSSPCRTRTGVVTFVA
jgi:hypothetical protein